MPKEPSPWSSVRVKKAPLIVRRAWVLGTDAGRIEALVSALKEAGHEVQSSESGSELGPSLREFKPDLVVIDMQDQPDRGRHVVGQLRADRATRQLPIILVGVGNAEEASKTQKAVTGPTRRYVLPMDAPSVIASIVQEL